MVFETYLIEMQVGVRSSYPKISTSREKGHLGFKHRTKLFFLLGMLLGPLIFHNTLTITIASFIHIIDIHDVFIG